MEYYDKYLKYKTKYLELTGGKRKKKTKYEKYENLNYYNHISNNNQNMGPRYSKNVSEPWFSLISLKLKTVEGRLNKGDFKEMQVGDTIEWTNTELGTRSFKTRVVRKTLYKSFKEYLDSEDINRCLPGIDAAHGPDIYYKYYTVEDEQKYGIVAIELEKI